jgi:preprotein translocase subunit Sec63
MEIRTNDRDLIHYFHDFGGSTKNSRRSYWLYRKIFKIIAWVVLPYYLPFGFLLKATRD